MGVNMESNQSDNISGLIQCTIIEMFLQNKTKLSI